MAIVALALYAVWLALAVFARVVLQVRRTGESGYRGVGAAGAAGWWVGGIGVVASVTAVAAPIADLAGLDTLRGVDAPAVNAIGVAVAVLGIGATFAAQMAMGDSWRMGVDKRERTELVTTGVFGLIRNPIYTTIVVASGGFALMVPNVPALISFAAFVVAFEVQVRGVEEPYLAQVHGAAYQRYAAEVGRFVPKVGRLPLGEDAAR
jgi:protein-S-isoprenylcysteine O-methyltransferase Ste14